MYCSHLHNNKSLFLQWIVYLISFQELISFIFLFLSLAATDDPFTHRINGSTKGGAVENAQVGFPQIY
jgi:hypothetical protein